jgi:uncharacterized protein (DUF2062 family)
MVHDNLIFKFNTLYLQPRRLVSQFWKFFNVKSLHTFLKQYKETWSKISRNENVVYRLPNLMNDYAMKETEQEPNPEKSGPFWRKNSIRGFIDRVKKLDGDPHYVAMGMAIGVFVGITPTMPFHTVLAVGLAFVFRGSKAAAALGVWFSNPFTAPLFYLGSYKVGIYLLGNRAPFNLKYESLLELINLGKDVTIAMIAGGIFLGILPGVVSYFITRKIFRTIRSKRASKI